MLSINQEKRAIKILETVFRRKINNWVEFTRSNVQDWDSLKNLELMLMIEEETGSTISEDDLAEIHNLNSLITYLVTLESKK
jgi:acyl carrier protein